MLAGAALRDRTFPPKTSRPFTLCLLLLAACASSPAPTGKIAPLDLHADPPDAAAAVDAASPLPPDVTNAVTITRPSTSCASTQEAFGARFDLLVAPHGASYARIDSARGGELALTDDGAAFVTADTGSGHVGGYVDIATAAVAVRKAIAFGGIFTPEPYFGAVRIEHVIGDHVTVHAWTPAGMTLTAAGPAALVASVPCTDLALDARTAEPSAVLGGAVPIRFAGFAAKHHVSIWADRAAKDPVAIFETDASSAEVSVMEQAGARARVSWEVPGGIVVGWVARSELRAAPPEERSNAAREARGARRAGVQMQEAAQFGVIGIIRPEPHTSPRVGESTSCPRAARMIAVVGERRYVVGTIQSGGTFGVRPADGALAPLDPPGSVDVESGVHLFVAARDVVGCEVATAPEIRDPSDAPRAADVIPWTFGGGGKKGDPKRP